MNSNWALLAPYLVIITAVQFGTTAIAKLLSASRFSRIERLSRVIEAAVGAATATSLVFVFAVWANETGHLQDPPANRVNTATSFAVAYGVVAIVFVIGAALLVFGGLKLRLATITVSALFVFFLLPGAPELVPTFADVLFGILFLGGVLGGTVWILLASLLGPDRLSELTADATSRVHTRRQAIVAWLEPKS
ncbi:hypothetical protein RD149_03545 [Gordonia westfalica]|uniref:Uncharacterized protein n=1 Tax=Gordonia westfalica TaxID=158898 RepID=A0ABU2GMZ2_9ACTN|nr:hypothetical protein [Gordonia westfalica]MDS1112833.1 hypothetical protein [Gordonia westfalica]